MRRFLLRGGSVTLLAILVTACASPPTLSVWTDPTHTPKAYRHLLVFGVANSAAIRRAYEENFTTQLAAGGVRATSSHTFIADAQLTRIVKITETISRTDADGVLVTHVIAERDAAAGEPVRLEAIPATARNLVRYFSQVHDEVHRSGYYSDYRSLRLETNLYDAREETLVWSGQSRPLDPTSEDTTISQIIADVIAQLRRDGYLPPSSAGDGTRQLRE